MKKLGAWAAFLAMAVVAAGCAAPSLVARIQPPGVYDTSGFGYSQVITVRAGKLVFVAGSVAYDQDRNLVGKGDLEAQMRQALKNLKRSLAAVGAGPGDIVRMRSFIVDFHEAYLPIVRRALADFFGEAPRPTSTLIGVQALARPELLVEIDATAAID